MAPAIYLRGEGGGVFAFDLPLPEGVQCRVDRDELVRVNEDGTQWVEETEAVEVIAPSAMKVDDLKAALTALGLPTDGNKPDLVARLESAQASTVEPLTDDEKLAAMEAKLLDDPEAEHNPAVIREELAKLAAAS